MCCCKSRFYFSILDGDGDGDSCLLRWIGTGMIAAGTGEDGKDVETIEGIGVGMGMRVVGAVGDGYKYLSPCSSLNFT